MTHASPERSPASQREMSELFDRFTRVAVRRSMIESNKGAFAPDGAVEPVVFHYPLDPVTIHSVFYSGKDEVRVDPRYAELTYATPHALEKSEADKPYSSVAIRFTGEHILPGGSIAFEADHEVIRDTFEGRVYGYVGIEYSFAGKTIGVGVFESGDALMTDSIDSFRSGSRPMHHDDLFKLQRLARRLGA